MGHKSQEPYRGVVYNRRVIMIGQNILCDKIFAQIERGKFPRFSILIGDKGSGKKTLCYEIAKRLDCGTTFVSTKSDDVREMIETSYKVDLPIVYVLADCDNMSSSSANALLKVVEEPPKNAYFILTCENIHNLLPTIKSRGVTYMMEPYSYEDKCDYLDVVNSDCFKNRAETEFVLNVSDNIGDVKTFIEMTMFSELSIKDFIEYVELVIDNIAEVSGSNSFKIGDKVALKDEEDKYNLRLFWRAFNSLCVDRMTEKNQTEPLKYARAVAITGECLSQLNINGLNKQMLFDTWILKIRGEWLYDSFRCKTTDTE